MKQTMRIWLALVLALCAGTTAWAGAYQLTTGTLTNCTVAFTVNSTDATTADENDEVTITVTPTEGYATKGITVTAYMTTGGMQARNRAQIIEDITATQNTEDPNVFTITMPAANIKVDATTTRIIQSTWIEAIAAQTYTGSAVEPTIVVKDGATDLVLGTDYTVAYSNNISAALSTDPTAPTVTVTAIGGTYSDATPKASATFTINKAAATISYATTAVSKAFGDAAFTNALSNTPAEGTDGTGLGTVTYAVTAETKDADCTSDNVATINAATGQVTITGTGTATITATVTDGDNYTYGTTTASYTLTVVKGTITASATGGSYTYSPSGSHGISVSVTKPTSGYTVRYGTASGTYEYSASPTFSAIGAHTVYYKVSADNYNDFTGQATVNISAAAGSLSFASSSLTKTYGEANFVNTLSKTGDGNVSYSSNQPGVATVEATTGLVTIQGVGTATITASMPATETYTAASATYTLTVTAADLSGAVISLDPTSFDYDGTAKEPSVKQVTLGSLKLTASTDYTVGYSNNTAAGTATATITGKGNYTGTASETFTINPKTLTTVMVGSIGAQTYTGGELTPVVTVTDGAKTLTVGTDYTVSYSNNTAAGTATATVTGKGNYQGDVARNFTVSAKTVTADMVAEIAAQTYTGSALTPAVTVTDGAMTLVSGTDFTVGYSDNTEAGTATATVTGHGNYTGTASKSFTISAKQLTGAMISPIGVQTYSGGPLTPAVTVMDGTKLLVSGTDYAVGYSSNTEAGTATVTVSGLGNYTGEASATFTIVKNTTPDTDEEASVTIGATGKTTYTGTRDLDFTNSSAEAYVAVGYDKQAKELTLARIYKVPAGTPILIKGSEGLNEVPFSSGVRYVYQNMFVGNISGATVEIGETDGGLTNYVLTGGEFKAVNTNAYIPMGKAYLQLPSTFPATHAGNSLTVTLTASGKTTLCSTVDLDFSGFSDMYAYAATGYDVSTKTVMLSRVLKASAGTPLILKGQSNGTYTIPSTAQQTTFANMFVGNSSGAAIQVGETDGNLVNYYLSSGEFKRVNQSLTVPDGKCYLQLPASALAARYRSAGVEDDADDSYQIVENNDILVIRIDADDSATGMEDLLKAAAAESDVYYNMKGQRVENPGKGIYVKNGRKVVIK